MLFLFALKFKSLDPGFFNPKRLVKNISNQWDKMKKK